MKYYILAFFMSLELVAAVDLSSTLLETAPITDSTVAVPQAAKIVEPQPIKRFRFGAPLTATEKYVADYLDDSNVLDVDFPALVAVAYEFPRFRHRVREILNSDLDIFDNDSLLLSVAYDIVSLREKASKLIEKAFRESADDTLLQVASHIPLLRPAVLSSVAKSLESDSPSPKILQIALSCSALRAKAIEIIATQLKEPEVQSDLLHVAYEVPEFKQTVFEIVEKKLPSKDLVILEIAAKEPTLRKMAVRNVKKLLSLVEPKIIRLALLLEL